MKKIIFASLCVFALTAAQAYAMDMDFDRDTNMVTISGTAQANENIAIVVTDSEMSSLEDISELLMETHSIGFYEANADGDGKYSVSFKSDEVDGMCNIFVSGEKATDKGQIKLYSEEALKDALETLSTAVSTGEDAVLEALKNENLRETLGIDEIYEGASDKSVIAKELVKNSEYNSFESLETALLPVECCEKFNTMINKVQVKELVKEMKEIYGGDNAVYTKYFGLANTDSIDSAVFKGKPYKNISEVYTAFEKAVKGNKPSSTGGGSTSGGGGGGITFPAASTAQSGEMPQGSTQTTQIFGDVASDYWGYEAIEALYKKGIVSGVSSNKFAPDQSVKREEFIKMLVALTGLEGKGKKDTFTDTNKSAWYSPYLAVAQECGLAFGKEDGSFGVGEVLTRQDMAVLAARVLGSTERGVAVTFADETEISDYARNSVDMLCGLKVMNGIGDGTFAPKATATRAQAAKVIYEISKIMK